MRLSISIVNAENISGEARPGQIVARVFRKCFIERSFRSMIPILLAIAMAATSCLSVGQNESESAPGGQLISDLAVNPNPRLGLAFPGGDPTYFHLMSDAGIGVCRMDAPWSRYEPVQGTFNWSGLDTKIYVLQQLGIEPFLTLESDVEWGVEPSTKSARNRPPNDLSEWKNFVKAMVERYDHDGENDFLHLIRPVRYYQAANEWFSENNPSGGWTGTRDQFIEYINATYDAVKASYSEAVFVLGGIAAVNVDIMTLREGYGDYTVYYHYDEDNMITITREYASNPDYEDFLRGVYRTLRECRYDYVDAHLYGPLEFNDARIALLSAKAPKMKMLSSECGGPSRDYDDDITPLDHFLTALDLNLDLLSRDFLFGLWFRLGEAPSASTYGNAFVALFDTSAQPKAGYWAYKLLASVLDKMDRVQKVGEGVYIIHRADASPALVAWNAGGSTLELPSTVQATQLLRVTDAAAGSYVIEAVPENGIITLGDLPVVASEVLPGQ
jgi:hypothetical protein